MERLEKMFEQAFVDAAMAEEGGNVASLNDEIEELAENFECSFVDVTFAEAGEFTETVCVPRHH